MNNLIKQTISSVDVTIEWLGPPLNDRNALLSLPPEARKATVFLSELELDGTLSRLTDTTWSLGFDQIDDLDDDSREALHIPYDLKISSYVSTLRSAEGRMRLLSLDMRHEEAGVLSRFTRHGPFISLGQGRHLLPTPQIRQLESHLTGGVDLDSYESTVAAQQAYHARAKELATEAGASVEPWLEREDYAFPEAIGLTMEGNLEHGIDLSPTAKGVEHLGLDEKLKESAGTRSVIWKGLGRQRKRIILRPHQRKAIAQLAEQSGHIAPDDIPDFLDTPEAFLPPDFDLSDFSDRVKGLSIRVYDSRPYLHVRHKQHKWFPDIKVSLQSATEDDGSPGHNPYIKPQEFLKRVREAQEQGKTSFTHEGNIIRFDQAAADSLEQLAPVIGDGSKDGISGSRQYILDIFENIDALEYTIDMDDQDQDEAELVRDILDFEVPTSVNAELRPFQKIGYNWLRTLDTRSQSGLLADDMGLGKTLQVISHLAAMAGLGRVSPSLAIVPKTLIDNWTQEIDKFCPSLRIARYQGGAIEDATVFESVDLVLTTYETLRRNQLDLAAVDWFVVICDEAQAIKNPTTGRTTAVKSLKSHTRIAMTGTPVENGLSELWSIMDWVQPGLLKSRLDFRQTFERPIIDSASVHDRSTHVRALQEKIINHYMRRMKEEVLEDLSEKHIHREEAPLSPHQMERYERLIHAAREGGRGAMLGCLQQLLQLCACPWDDTNAYAVTGTPEEIEECPKLGLVINRLEEIRSKEEKVLIFVERLTTQAMLQQVIQRRFGIHVELINGSITQGRQAIVDRFTTRPGFQAMILSPKVGGTGLNITSANHVIHYMRPWNPAIENQATDRVYRIGQERDVHVYLPIATWPGGIEKSVEEVLDELIQGKTELATDVIVPTARMSLDRDVLERVFIGQA